MNNVSTEYKSGIPKTVRFGGFVEMPKRSPRKFHFSSGKVVLSRFGPLCGTAEVIGEVYPVDL